MMCRLCGYELDKNESTHCSANACCGKCSKQSNKNMVQCPNCGYVNYIKSNDSTPILKRIKEKLSI